MKYHTTSGRATRVGGFLVAALVFVLGACTSPVSDNSSDPNVGNEPAQYAATVTFQLPVQPDSAGTGESDTPASQISRSLTTTQVMEEYNYWEVYFRVNGTAKGDLKQDETYYFASSSGGTLKISVPPRQTVKENLDGTTGKIGYDILLLGGYSNGTTKTLLLSAFLNSYNNGVYGYNIGTYYKGVPIIPGNNTIDVFLNSTAIGIQQDVDDDDNNGPFTDGDEYDIFFADAEHDISAGTFLPIRLRDQPGELAYVEITLKGLKKDSLLVFFRPQRAFVDLFYAGGLKLDLTDEGTTPLFTTNEVKISAYKKDGNDYFKSVVKSATVATPIDDMVPDGDSAGDFLVGYSTNKSYVYVFPRQTTSEKTPPAEDTIPDKNDNYGVLNLNIEYVPFSANFGEATTKGNIPSKWNIRNGLYPQTLDNSNNLGDAFLLKFGSGGAEVTIQVPSSL